MDWDAPQSQPVAVRRIGSISGVGVSFRVTKDPVLAGFRLSRVRSASSVRRGQTTSCRYGRRENLIIHQTGLFEMAVLLIGKHDHLFCPEAGFPFRYRPHGVLPIDVVDTVGTVIENGLFLIYLGFLQGEVFRDSFWGYITCGNPSHTPGTAACLPPPPGSLPSRPQLSPAGSQTVRQARHS